MRLTLNKTLVTSIIIILSIFRFIYLDQDVHSRMIEGISQGDEVFYAFAGYEQYLQENNRLINDDEDIKFYKGLSFNNYPLTYLSLHIFGNNYYGLRLSSVLSSLLAIFLLYRVSIKIYTKNSELIFYSIIFLFSDFYFFIISRFQTPQIHSIFIISLILYIFYQNKLATKHKFFILSFLGFSAVTIYYTLNLFVLAAIGTYILIISIKQKRFSYILYSLAGAILSIILYLTLVYLVDENIFDYYQRITEFQENYEVTQTSKGIIESFRNFIISSLSIITTNLFRFNPILLWTTLTFIIHFTFLIFKKKGSNDQLFIYLILIFAFAQAFFVNSYPFKKWVVLVPVAYTILFIILKELPNKKTLITSTFITGLLYAYSLKINHSPEYWLYENWGYYVNIRLVYIVAILSTFILFLYSALFRKHRLIKTALVLSSITFSIMNLDYFVFNKQTVYKDAMTKFSPLTNHNKIIAGNSRGFSFYSEVEPILHPTNFFKGYEDISLKSLKKHLSNYENSYRIIHVRRPYADDYPLDSTISIEGFPFKVLDKVYEKDSLFSIVLTKHIKQEKH